MIALWAGLILGLAVLVNFIFIVRKFKSGRPIDASIDIFTIGFTSSLYGMSIVGGAIATLGSMFISIYLHYKPLTNTKETQSAKRWQEKIDSFFE